ncbi:sulfatase-like hydrolase/transferase, partial [bacterium]|nr:sulfatase-like hydrolase/transferase [candidate division CSSED10-310 bacterium]
MDTKIRFHNADIHLKHYFWFSYLLVLVNTFGYLRHIEIRDGLTFVFALTVYIAYGFIYLAFAFAPVFILKILFSLRFIDALLLKIRVRGEYLLYGLAVLLSSFLQVLILTDKQIFSMYDFHLNGFVWNLLTTKGGLESLGSSASTITTFVIVCIGIVLVQTLLLVAVIHSRKLAKLVTFIFKSKQRRILATSLLILACGFQVSAYGACELAGHSPVLAASTAFPFYFPVTFKHLAKRLGYEIKRDESFAIHANSGSIHLNYPLQPIQIGAGLKKYNIVWLVAESWRADMLDPEIMPATSSFAQNAATFINHYSSGNGTRMALFSMFYGLYGNYWFSFLDERRSPVFIDILLDHHYQMKMFTSALFSYPEFDKTIFSRIPSEDLVERDKKLSGWENDRQNVTKMLDFISNRDRSRPFMAFMFFESPHANYYFPDESIIRKDYLPDLNYATMDLKKDIQLIKNRYINSCHHMDSQYQRIFDYLRDNNLMNSTIVIVTGDHGEEFMEKGHWGHNSAFTEEQLRVPLIIKIPNHSGSAITDMSSHMDIP